jgi:hypothetical protein
MLIFVLFATRLRMRYEFVRWRREWNPQRAAQQGFPWPDSEGASIASERRKDLENAKNSTNLDQQN